MQEAVNQVHRFATVVGLRINASKTKVLSANVDPLLHQVINVGGEPLEEVSSFKYLGASFTATGQAFGEIKARINVERAAFNLRSGRVQKSRERPHLRVSGQNYPANGLTDLMSQSSRLRLVRRFESSFETGSRRCVTSLIQIPRPSGQHPKQLRANLRSSIWAIPGADAKTG